VGTPPAVSRISKIVLVCLIAALVVAIPAGSAAAKKKRRHARHATEIGSTITLDSVNADGFSGHVSAPRSACLGQRQVTVYMVNTDGSVPSSGPIGTAISRSDGSWGLGGWAYPGEYFAVVATTRTRDAVCGSATSNAVIWWTGNGPPPYS
jgi:hypothetical protein